MQRLAQIKTENRYQILAYVKSEFVSSRQRHEGNHWFISFIF